MDELAELLKEFTAIPGKESLYARVLRQRIFSEAEAAHRDARRHGTKSASASLKIL
jgi:hypothetical protein